MAYHGGVPEVDQEERREFLKALGVTGAAVAGAELSVRELREQTAAGRTAELATMGEAIRSDLAGSLDTELLSASTAGLEEGFEQLPALAEIGFPEREASHYAELVAPGWEVYDHLKDVAFFESIERHLPGFTTDHIVDTSRELVRSEPLTETLTGVGFTDEELATVVASIVNSADRLALWVPTRDIPEGVEFNVDAIAPVHQRAAGGALLWIEDLDTHLWQKQYLLTEELVEQGLWDVKVMLGGLQLVSEAAADMAGEGALTEEQLATALTAGSAAMIVGQQNITNDLFRITEEMRAPRNGGEIA